MQSYITTKFVLATNKIRSREKREIKRERVTKNVKRQNVLEQILKRKKSVRRQNNIAGRLPENSRDRRMWRYMN